MVRLQDPEGESRVDLQAGQSSSRLRLRTTSTRPVVLFTTYVWLDFWPRESKPCNARSFAKVWRRQVGLLGRGLASANSEARASKHSQVHRRGRQMKLPEVRNRRCTNRREQAEHAVLEVQAGVLAARIETSQPRLPQAEPRASPDRAWSGRVLRAQVRRAAGSGIAR